MSGKTPTEVQVAIWLTEQLAACMALWDASKHDSLIGLPAVMASYEAVKQQYAVLGQEIDRLGIVAQVRALLDPSDVAYQSPSNSIEYKRNKFAPKLVTYRRLLGENPEFEEALQELERALEERARLKARRAVLTVKIKELTPYCDLEDFLVDLIDGYADATTWFTELCARIEDVAYPEIMAAITAEEQRLKEIEKEAGRVEQQRRKEAEQEAAHVEEQRRKEAAEEAIRLQQQYLVEAVRAVIEAERLLEDEMDS